MPTAFIVIENLSFTYPPARRGQAARTALHGVSFSVPEGSLFGLLGPNGGGKTTTFHVLSTLRKPSGGRVVIQGTDVIVNPGEARRKLGVVFQNPSVDLILTVRENLVHQGQLYGLQGKILSQRITEALERLGLTDRANDRVKELSGGLRRRVEIAKSLLHEPSILLMDEPTTGLDPGARHDVWQYLAELRQRRAMTVIVTTHLMEEASQCSEVVILNEGRIVAQGSPAALTEEIGGDVIVIETREATRLAAGIQNKFQLPSKIIDGKIHIERSEGHVFIPQLIAAFPQEIQAVRLSKPSLEDVFIRRTGHKFWAGIPT